LPIRGTDYDMTSIERIRRRRRVFLPLHEQLMRNHWNRRNWNTAGAANLWFAGRYSGWIR
jgi:hypothetical protein